MNPRVLIIGVGNPDCGDDGIGPLVARRLAPRLPPGVAVKQRSGDALGLIDDWADVETVFLVDAAAPISAPGNIHRVDPEVEPLPKGPEGLSLTSTHAFGIAEAIALARQLDRLPARLVIYAVEGECFDPGADMTPMVSAAIDQVAERITNELNACA